MARKKARWSGTGKFCVSSTRKGPGGKGLSFQVTCYKSQDAAVKAIPQRIKGAYNAMIFKKSAKRGKKRRK